jgi:hypothetical protein
LPLFRHLTEAGAASIMGKSAAWCPSQETYKVNRWGKGKEELGTRVTLSSYRIYVQKSTSGAYGGVGGPHDTDLQEADNVPKV